MKVTLIDRQPVTVAYLRHLGPYGEAIAQFWQNTYYPWAVSNNLQEQARYGISYDDPSITAAEQCRYDACVEVAPDFVLSGGALKTTIPGGKYAALRYSGTSERVVDAWTALLREWLPASGLQLDARPLLRVLPDRCEVRPPDRGVRVRDIHSRRSTLNGSTPNMAFERGAPEAARPSTSRCAPREFGENRGY